MLRSFSITMVTAMVFVFVLLLLQFVDFSGGSKPQRVHADFTSITSAVESYRRFTGAYPTSSQGWSALLERPPDLPASASWTPFLNSAPVDPWQNEYLYRKLPGDDPRGFELRSLGRDGVPSEDDLVSGE